MIACSVWKLLIFICALNVLSTEGNDKDQIHLEAKPQLYDSISLKESNQFGHDVSENGQFHHENRGIDGIAYGCHGYRDDSGQLQLTHYVTDARGYRVIQPNQPVQLYMVATNPPPKGAETADLHPLRSEQPPPKPMPNREPHSCRPDGTAQSNVPAATALAPVGGALGGLLGGLVGGLLQGLGQGLGVNLLAPNNCAATNTHVIPQQCTSGCNKNQPAYVGLIPTIYQPRSFDEQLINSLEAMLPNLLEHRGERNNAPMYWLLPSSQEGNWRSESRNGLMGKIYSLRHLQQRRL
ncbi:uncharacterized protein LOC131687040 [Topomyia yanbarensis]|uniref:uncharacterized protein LOC131687040 n=1 Tax=Topomyia yanbarensis TaxID=2498891 RepID=UPI00273C483F|nr:uncharacterized protein LOC131687040 [Topomyia yanbarensis]